MRYITYTSIRNVILLVILFILSFVFVPQFGDVSKGGTDWNTTKFPVPVYVRFGGGYFNFPDLVEAVQLQVNKEMEQVPELGIQLLVIDELKRGLQDQSHVKDHDENEYYVELVFSQENSLSIDPNYPRLYHSYNLESIHSNDLPFLVTQSIIYHLLSPELNIFKQGLTGSNESQYKILIMMDDTISSQVLFQFRSLLDSYISKFEGLFDLSIDFIINKAPFNKSSMSDLCEFNETLDTVGKMNFNAANNIENIRNIQSFSISQLKSISNDTMLWLDFMSPVIETMLGLPFHPSNNLGLKIMSLKRFRTIQYMKDIEQKDKASKSKLKQLVNLIMNDPLGDWSFFYSEAKTFYTAGKVKKGPSHI